MPAGACMNRLRVCIIVLSSIWASFAHESQGTFDRLHWIEVAEIELYTDSGCTTKDKIVYTRLGAGESLGETCNDDEDEECEGDDAKKTEYEIETSCTNNVLSTTVSSNNEDEFIVVSQTEQVEGVCIGLDKGKSQKVIQCKTEMFCTGGNLALECQTASETPPPLPEPEVKKNKTFATVVAVAMVSGFGVMCLIAVVLTLMQMVTGTGYTAANKVMDLEESSEQVGA
jgi:hypothetical protein